VQSEHAAGDAAGAVGRGDAVSGVAEALCEGPADALRAAGDEYYA
jgi:hypothetical protein